MNRLCRRRRIGALFVALVISACSSTTERSTKAAPGRVAGRESPASTQPDPSSVATSAPPPSSTARAPTPPKPAGTPDTSAGEALGGTIKIGFVLRTGNPGAMLGLDAAHADNAPVVRAVVDHVNATGGIAGRRIVAAIRTVDGSDFATQARLRNEACVALTEDERVFMVVGGPVLQAQHCYAAHRTPVLGGDGDDEQLRELAPWILPGLSLGFSMTSVAELLPEALRDQGFLTSRMAVVSDEAITPGAESLLVERLEALGGRVVDRVRLAVSVEGFTIGTASAVRRFRLQGVDRVVFFATGSGPFILFARVAEAQGYRPRYGVSSYDAPDGAQQFVPTEQLRGAVGAGWVPAGDVPDEVLPPTPGERACWAAVNQRIGTSFSRRSLRQNGIDARPATALEVCEALALARAALAPLAGRPLDPAAVYGHIQALGDHRSLNPAGAFFAPEKMDAGKNYAHLAFDAEGCACFRYVSGWRRAPS